MDWTLIAVIVTALFFDFTNGFHDAANAVATSSPRARCRRRAGRALAAVLNVVGAFVSTDVAATIAKGIVDPGASRSNVILGGLIGAIIWNLLTWYLGLPSSSCHA